MRVVVVSGTVVVVLLIVIITRYYALKNISFWLLAMKGRIFACPLKFREYPNISKKKMEILILILTFAIAQSSSASMMRTTNKLRIQRNSGNNFQDSLGVFREEQKESIDRSLLCGTFFLRSVPFPWKTHTHTHDSFQMNSVQIRDLFGIYRRINGKQMNVLMI